MKATELRIGNLIDTGNGVVGEVTAILIGGNVSTTKGVGHVSEFNGLPLNEELVLRLGFNLGFKDSKERDRFYLGVNNFCFIFCNNELILEGNGGYDDAGEMELPNIIYVHQLQNLYFALTGKELKL